MQNKIRYLLYSKGQYLNIAVTNEEQANNIAKFQGWEVKIEVNGTIIE